MARALVNDPDFILMDEPTTGLDPQARHVIWERLKQLLARGKTQGVVELAVYSNRYCLALFTPLTAFLLVYGFELYSLWISPAVATRPICS